MDLLRVNSGSPELTSHCERGYIFTVSINRLQLADNMFEMARYGATRGHSFELHKHQSRLNLRKHIFSQRTVDVWNSLPDDVAIAPSLNILKHRLDYHWRNEIFLLNYINTRAALTSGNTFLDKGRWMSGIPCQMT